MRQSWVFEGLDGELVLVPRAEARATKKKDPLGAGSTWRRVEGVLTHGSDADGRKRQLVIDMLVATGRARSDLVSLPMALLTTLLHEAVRAHLFVLRGRRRQRPSGGGGAPPKPPEPPPGPKPPPAAKTFVDILVEYEDETPYTGRYRLKLPSGQVSEGTLPADGHLRVDGLNPGSCELSFPDLDAASWKAS